MTPAALSSSSASADALPALAPGDIQLWLTDYDDIADERLHQSYRALLSDEERRQEPRFYFQRDRRRYLVTRALVRTVLSKYLPARPESWRFSTNAYGRPEIANMAFAEANVLFNISHTHSLVVLGVTRSAALGVDVENVVARPVSIDIAGRYFSPVEVAALAKVSPHRQQYRFFEYWTFKESYIKARGMGLSLPLDQFSFHYPHDAAVSIQLDPELRDDESRWRFWQFQVQSKYIVAVCVERIRACAPCVTVRRIVPLVGECELAPKFLRTSE